MKYYKTIQVEKRQIRTHRYLMEKKLGRKLKPDELVHHIDENKNNNAIDNLVIVTRSEHKKLHPEIGKETRYKQKYTFVKEEIVKLYEENTIDEISKIFNCSIMTIWNFMKKNNINTKKRKNYE
jgi:hypothetical protein